MADFSNYELGTNVAELADGLLPEMAEVFEVPLSANPTAEELGKLVGAIGASKVLQQNIPRVQAILGTATDGLTVAADWLDRSGVQQSLERSLWTPDQITSWDRNRVVITGAVANWQDRVTDLLIAKASSGVSVDGRVDIAVGNRVMNTPTETTNPNVQIFEREHNRPPTEADYASWGIMPALRMGGYPDVQVLYFDTTSGDEIAHDYFQSNPGVLNDRVIFARVANAGIQLACQFRKAARLMRPDFDSDPDNPQVFVSTDSFPIARTSEDLKNPRQFQNPFTGIRQVALTGKLLVEAAQS